VTDVTAARITGRFTELDAIAGVWAKVSSGDAPHTVVVSGAPGVGKSRLVAEAVDLLDPAPVTVLLGYGRAGSPAPYDWLATALRGRDVGGLPVAAEALAWLTQSRAPSHRLEPTALLRAGVDVVRQLVGDGPGVLIVEDVQALDPASLTLVRRLSEATGLAVLLFVVNRPCDATRPVAQLLEQLAGAAHTTRLLLGPPGPAPLLAGEAAWARYCHALGRPQQAAPAALRGAARLVASGRPREAMRLVESCLAVDEHGDTDTDAAQLVLARTLLLLGRTEEARSAAARAAEVESGGDGEAVRLHRGLSTAAELTAREREVLGCLAAGMSNRQVARSLDISVRTVTVHVSNLLRKTGTGSRTEAALWAVQHGLSGCR
jgi:two-component system nitrate/nitrite response regulator NarL